ncbi:MAG: hypothetical protein Q8O40_10095 [Chloroflexota bacterium]|nr:hypothetical protein [Chloroflexota bacterium]
MMKVPTFLLRRLYVKGSLRNTPDGFQFEMKNSLGSGYARKLLPLDMDGTELPLESSTFQVNGASTGFAEVSEEKPFTLAMNRTVTISVKGVTLTPQAHKLTMGFEVRGLGILRFDFSDVPGDG